VPYRTCSRPLRMLRVGLPSLLCWVLQERGHPGERCTRSTLAARLGQAVRAPSRKPPKPTGSPHESGRSRPAPPRRPKAGAPAAFRQGLGAAGGPVAPSFPGMCGGCESRSRAAKHWPGKPRLGAPEAPPRRPRRRGRLTGLVPQGLPQASERGGVQPGQQRATLRGVGFIARDPTTRQLSGKVLKRKHAAPARPGGASGAPRRLGPGRRRPSSAGPPLDPQPLAATSRSKAAARRIEGVCTVFRIAAARRGPPALGEATARCIRAASPSWRGTWRPR